MQLVPLFGKALLIAFFLLGAVESLAAAENADMRANVAKSHASIRAYPTAVVSLKDPKSETIFYVESNGRRLVALDKQGAVAWNVDVLDAIKAPPGVGQPVIRDLQLGKGVVHMTIAKHSFADIQIGSGKVTYLGSD